MGTFIGQQPAEVALTTGDLGDNIVDGTKTKDALIADYSDVTVTAADLIMYGDATDSNNTKRDTVQGILDLAGGGAWNFIATSVADDSASLTLTGIDSTYDTYAIAWSDIKNATDNVNLYFRVGDSGGIDTGAADYQFGCLYNLANSTGQASSIGGDENIDEAFIMLSSDYQGGMNLQATGTCGGLMYLHSPADAEGYPLMTWTFQQNTTNNDATWSVGGVGHGNRKAQITTSQVQFYMSSGNITSGRAVLWGLAHA